MTEEELIKLAKNLNQKIKKAEDQVKTEQKFLKSEDLNFKTGSLVLTFAKNLRTNNQPY